MTGVRDVPHRLFHPLSASCDEELTRTFPEVLIIRSPTFFEWRCRKCYASLIVERARTTHAREYAALLAQRRRHDR